MNEQERRINEAARFQPMQWHGPDGNDDPGDRPHSLPHMEVGGVQVYAYFEDGVLCVSMDYDTAQEEVTTGDDKRVPTKVRASGFLLWASEREAAPYRAPGAAH
jgi:hypothetical protein